MTVTPSVEDHFHIKIIILLCHSFTYIQVQYEQRFRDEHLRPHLREDKILRF